MLTDYHCHILPGMDDGAPDVDTSLDMIDIMKEQGVERIIATPHFYAHEERSLTEYLLRREDAFESIADFASVPNIILGAEVAIEHGISKIHGIDKLAIEDSDMILLELPFRDYEDWMSEEINAIASEYGLKIVLAHIHRYLTYYSPENFEKILQTDAVFQFNNDAFLLQRDRDLLKQLVKEKRTIIFGSDAHNTDTRCPNWDVCLEVCDPEVLEASNELLKINTELLQEPAPTEVGEQGE
ncbi:MULTISPECIES: CpsB/CapC family capsule biosynthesis tyrosine phosphatase [Ruminococcus]|uniref:protein-tyrosine-phosphatase n=1 Tax=Ruminococcus flavefaciens TaxID=1265 RepID=A0A1M7KED0_RUMFL|nr:MULTISPECIES: CpsB/CapC family capsule biosynthesis tyrosine phosphatase [Ruminococcus]MCR4795504.1 capsular polysaccharide biosynthesis protein [Ruminococcus sp.]SHM63404.1 protein-tyrosine phosphatase [Ruminococcus flavefaciens]